MQDLKGSKTYDNLLIAYAGESQARNKYEFFAAKAQEEGYRQIAELFHETADNEKEHAEIWYKHFVGIGTTPENLMTAAEGEHYEWSEMYDDMACVARGRFRADRPADGAGGGYREGTRDPLPEALGEHKDPAGLCQRQRSHMDLRQLRTRSQRQGRSGNLSGLPSRPRDQGGELLVDRDGKRSEHGELNDCKLIRVLDWLAFLFIQSQPVRG